uniref:Derlin n=1 Tax=Trypanosoma congolense (strain IL3000) TaxID=1068625 RepID=G0V2E5_TRYCI|nr:unnamed protein product [Trypanosoma congolense IL3000]
MAQSFESWIEGLCPITRFILMSAVFLSAVVTLQVQSFTYVMLDFSTITSLQIWRPFTSALFFGRFSFPWFISMAMFVSYLKYNEEYDFQGKPADFAWMLLFIICGLSVGGLLLGLPIVSGGLLMALCWIFCKRHPQVRMTLYSFEFNATPFPWVLVVFHFMLGQSIMEDLLGIFVGHMFFFMHDLMPLANGVNLITTPAWFVRLLRMNNAGERFGTVHSGPQPYNGRPARQAQQGAGDGRYHRWGAGRVLGTA